MLRFRCRRYACSRVEHGAIGHPHVEMCDILIFAQQRDH